MTASMRAACLVASGLVEVREFPVPQPRADQVLVRMHYASICGSDVHIVFDGFHREDQLGRPGYPGHEGVGVVERDGGGLTAGTPVLTVPHGQLGACFAELQAVEATHVIPLPEGADLRRTLLAQQLGTTIFGMKKFLPVPTEPGPVEPGTAAVIGSGSAGLFYLQHLVRRGFDVLVSDLDEGRLAVAKRLGAAQIVHEPAESIVAAVLAATDGVGADVVIEAAGYDVARAAAVEAARVRGTVGFFGYPELKGLAPFPVERSFRKSLTMEWVNGTQQEHGLASFRAAIAAITAGEIEVDHCLEKMYALDDAPEALAAARAHGHGAAKVGIVMPGAAE
ncbi:zinc-binding dehydrogenase [Pseudonocardia sp. TRM90224]|uniref:zinc-binding dehydrogenase n=1 Tax=Pseudonocardia sp. TRM90224 TaxID=2812678 RepID=UPI001E42B3A1|nr:zinc-binding dehydrogenase [Pseudonocardia sp. TRM90224]